MKKDILLCGVGGQGTVLASRILAQSAMEEGFFARTSETIGMAQRGGPVTSHVRIGGEVQSPLVPLGGADLMLAFEPSEAVRNLARLKKGGLIIVNTVPTMPVTEALRPSGYTGAEMINFLKSRHECIPVNASEACAEIGNGKVFNILLLGIAAGSGRLGLQKETLLKVIRQRVPQKAVEINEKAFEYGWALGQR